MKKHLIATAVAAVVAAPAMAQNVTIGGNFDMSYDFGKQNETTQTFNTQGSVSTSALTIGGSEDLGGGLKAFFNINSRLGHGAEIDGDVGLGQVGVTNVGTRQGTINFGDRGFQVGISGAFGEIAIGKTTGTAMGGTIRGGVAGNLSLLQESSWGDRPNNMISYTTPSLNGLKGRVVYSVETSSSELSVNYVNGPITIDAAYASISANTDAAQQSATTDVKGTDYGLRVGYNMGVAAFNVSYIRGETGISYDVGSNQYSVGVTVPMGNLSLVGEIGSRGSESTQDFDDAASTKKTGGQFYNVGGIYNLSKRTNVYGFYNKVSKSNDAKATALENEGKLLVGIRHSF